MKYPQPLRVLLFEGDARQRASLTNFVSTEADFLLVGVFSNFWEMEVRVRKLSPDAVLIDLDLGPAAPYTALRKVLAVRKLYPAKPPAIIILSQYKDDERIIQSYSAGGNVSYLIKPSSRSEICGAVRQAVQGNPCANEYVEKRSRELLGNPINRANARKLTKREFLALRLLKQGCTQKEAAARMGIKSVNDTMKSIYRKLSVHNQRDAENKVWYNHLEMLGRIKEG